jgi:hypothetical protein
MEQQMAEAVEAVKREVREVGVACSCGHAALLFLDREAPLPTTIRCSECGVRGPVSAFISRFRRRATTQSDAMVALVPVR